MTDATIRITGLNRCTTPSAWTSGDCLLAYIDVEARGFAVRSCLLIRRQRGDHYLQLPKIEGRGGERRAIMIVDTELRERLTEAALDALSKFEAATNA